MIFVKPYDALDGLGQTIKSFGTSLTGKFAEGAANWLLMKRLGRRTKKMLKPIA